MSEEKEKKEFSVDQFTNSRLLKCYGIVSAVLFAAYFLEWVKGNRTLGYTLVFSVILLSPLMTAFLVYQRDGESRLIRSIAVYGYGVLYAFVLWTTVSDLAFTYYIPMLVAIAMYGDKKFTLRAGIAAIFINVVYVGLQFIRGAVDSAQLVNFEIEIADMLLVVIFSYVASNTLGKISDYRMGMVEAERARVGEMLDTIIHATDSLCTSIVSIDQESKQMADKGANSKQAVAQMVSGTTELAQTIQRQQQMTENINGLTNSAGELIMQIKDKFEKTIQISHEGNRNMLGLEKASETSREVGQKVNETMEELLVQTAEAKQILSMIDGITRQTALLALNASIEAARAGEAGAGFAVVADQIKQLAEETQNATRNISGIVGALEEQADLAGSSVESLISTNENQMGLVEQTKASFDEILSEITHIREEIDREYSYMEKVTASNNEINQHVESLSAFSQELLANTENTKELSDQTIQGAESINGLLDHVMTEVQGLQSMIETK
ncbi:MAG: hypothetical protein J6B10_09380 [Lachnospiraceae bacterium]|nr:hypothetical protein [Lachnospiraceae bacterium]